MAANDLEHRVKNLRRSTLLTRNRHGMRVSNRSVLLLADIIVRRAEKARKERHAR